MQTTTTPKKRGRKPAETVLTKEEKKYLMDRGYSLDDVNEIAYAMKHTTYRAIGPDGTEEPITERKAILLLGRDEWLSGLCRSAFHVTATRGCQNGTRVAFRSVTWLN